MRRFFCRQLTFYARYHQDPRNCVTHYLGIPMLFVAAILPLEAVRIPLGGHLLPLGMLLTLPAVIGWIVLDLGVGATLALLLCPLFAVVELIVRTGSPALLWSCFAGLFLAGWSLQFMGHAVYERRRPAFVDDLSQTLIGPMFVAAKLLVALGLRADLAAAMGEKERTETGRRAAESG
jgi:uncharacterized membrane protein YGL010W